MSSPCQDKSTYLILQYFEVVEFFFLLRKMAEFMVEHVDPLGFLALLDCSFCNLVDSMKQSCLS